MSLADLDGWSLSYEIHRLRCEQEAAQAAERRRHRVYPMTDIPWSPYPDPPPGNPVPEGAV